jgi:TonB family protein
MTAPARRHRLNLQRRPTPQPEDDLHDRQERTFWRWVVLIALLHVAVIVGAYLFYLFSPAAKPAEQFITLLPPGDTVKGTAGTQQAHKIGANTPAAPSHHAAPSPPPAPPPIPKIVTPPAEIKPPLPPPLSKDALAPVVPAQPTPPKPATPPKPKVKVDLHEVERTDVADTETHAKPVKHHAKKPAKKSDDSADEADSSPDNTGLSKEQIAKKLGEKLNASGSHNAVKSGASGAPEGHDNRFQDYYDLIGQQVHDEWNSPNASSAVQTEPLVEIYVERDGRVPPESVRLLRSSGDPAYDDDAIATVKRIGYLREPLPEGCPPVIHINFNPNP